MFYDTLDNKTLSEEDFMKTVFPHLLFNHMVNKDFDDWINKTYTPSEVYWAGCDAIWDNWRETCKKDLLEQFGFGFTIEYWKKVLDK